MNNSQGEMQQSWIAWWKSEKKKRKAGYPAWLAFVCLVLGWPRPKTRGAPNIHGFLKNCSEGENKRQKQIPNSTTSVRAETESSEIVLPVVGKKD